MTMIIPLLLLCRQGAYRPLRVNHVTCEVDGSSEGKFHYQGLFGYSEISNFLLIISMD